MTQSGHAAFIFLCKAPLTRNPGYNLLPGRKRHRGKAMNITRHFAAGLISALIATPCFAQQQTVKIGLLVPLTGPFTPTGKQLTAGARLYMQQNGDTVAGKKIELIVKDDTGNADMTKRLAQELVVNDKVSFLAGFGLTPRSAGDGADRHRGQNSGSCDDGGDLDHHRALALHCPHELLGSADDGSARRLGGGEWDQDRGNGGLRLRTRD
jgi:hypothetical protein